METGGIIFLEGDEPPDFAYRQQFVQDALCSSRWGFPAYPAQTGNEKLLLLR
jgi:hypothetical protein